MMIFLAAIGMIALIASVGFAVIYAVEFGKEVREYRDGLKDRARANELEALNDKLLEELGWYRSKYNDQQK
jgi:hypothetical protein